MAMTTAANAHTRATDAQRNYIHTLLRRAELATDRFTFMHRVPWQHAGLPEPPFDGGIDAALRRLTKAEATRLIRALERAITD